jgi:dihydrofolate reductase
MGKLIYSLTTSLDGYVEDDKGNFDWTSPSDEVLALIDDVLKNVGTFLFGRRMYETMAVWETISPDGPDEGMNKFANIWNGASKIVYSSTLTEVSTANTTLERAFDALALHKVIAESNKDFNIGGPHLAAEAIRAGIVDEFHQYIAPKILGGTNFWLPKKVEADLELVDVHKFDNGVVHLQYKPVS